MTDERDSGLQQLFDAASECTYEDGFVADVMSTINRRRRRAIAGWAVVAIAMVPVAGLLGGLLQDVFQLLAQVLPSTLVDTEADWLARALAPANTIGALVAFAFLGLRAAYRRIFA